MAKTTFNSVDDYIAAQPAAVQPLLERVRAAIRKALPKAEEVISYGIPTFKLHNDPVIYFAGWKKHYSLYPVGARVVAAFKNELAPYTINKTTIRLPLTEAVPEQLIGRIARFRAEEIAGHRKPRKAASKTG